jgi:hypothetical protein
MCLADAGFTFIPQTGSRSSVVAFEAVIIWQKWMIGLAKPFGEKALPQVCLAKLSSLIADVLYWIHPAGWPGHPHHSEGPESMTYLDVVFNYGAIPGENEMRAIDTMREVYGIRQVQFNAKQRTVRVEFDASRLKQDAVAKLLRNAGVDVREQVALA